MELYIAHSDKSIIPLINQWMLLYYCFHVKEGWALFFLPLVIRIFSLTVGNSITFNDNLSLRVVIDSE